MRHAADIIQVDFCTNRSPCLDGSLSRMLTSLHPQTRTPENFRNGLEAVDRRTSHERPLSGFTQFLWTSKKYPGVARNPATPPERRIDARCWGGVTMVCAA